MDISVQELKVLSSQKKELEEDHVTNGRNRRFIKKKSASQQGTVLGKLRHSIAPALSRANHTASAFSAHALLHTCLTGEEFTVFG